MPKIVGDAYDRVAWDVFLSAEIALEDALSARAEIAGRSCEGLKGFLAVVRLAREGFWRRKSELLKEFGRRYGHELPEDVFFFRDENMFPVVVWGKEAEDLGFSEFLALDSESQKSIMTLEDTGTDLQHLL